MGYQVQQDPHAQNSWREAPDPHCEEEAERAEVWRLQEAFARNPCASSNGVQAHSEASSHGEPCLWRFALWRLHPKPHRSGFPHRGTKMRQAGACREDVAGQGPQEEQEVRAAIGDLMSLRLFSCG